VIHFDDFQHTSPIVRQFALELAHTAYTELEAAQPDAKPRLLLIFSSNGREHQAKVAIPEMQTVDVKPFDEKCSRDFIRRLFGQNDVPEEIVNRLAPVAQGNPRMLVELSKTLVREKLVRYSGSRWVFPESLSGVALPGTLVDSLVERLRSLGSTTRALLDWLSITYSSVTATVLSRLMNTPVEDLEGLLKRLIRDGLVARDERFDDPQYDMAHQGLKEHIAKEHTEERRKFLHQRMAQTFERDLGEGDQQETARAELLAHHWLAADNPAAVLRYAPSAAGYLQRAGSLQKALEYHQLLFENMQTEALAKKIKSLARLAEMHELLWDLEGSTAHLNKILELGGNLLRPNDRASLLRRMAGIEIARQDHGKAIKRLTESRNALDGGHADPITTLSVDAPEAWARWMAGESDAARSLLKRAEATLSTLDAAASTSDPRSRALRIASVSHLANLHHHLGHLDRATTLHRQNLGLLEGQEMRQAEAATRTSLSTALLDAGDKEEAIGHLEAAIELGSEIGDRRTLCRARERLGELHFLYRDLRSALHVAQMSLDDAKALKNLSAVANSRMLLGRIYHRAGQGNDAAEVFRRALGVYRELGDRTGLCLCQIHLTRNFIVEGNTLKAVEQVDHLKSELGPEVSSRVHALYKLTQAEVDFCASGKVDLAACQEAQSTLEEGGFKRDSLSIRLFACHVATSRSEFDKARSLLEELADPLEHIGSKEQQAEARLIRAHIEVGGGYCETAVETLNELSRWASRNVFPRLVDRCNDTSRELLDVSLSV
jgi:tetratricopeptide (TPR) repeat protein